MPAPFGDTTGGRMREPYAARVPAGEKPSVTRKEQARVSCLVRAAQRDDRAGMRPPAAVHCRERHRRQPSAAHSRGPRPDPGYARLRSCRGICHCAKFRAQPDCNPPRIEATPRWRSFIVFWGRNAQLGILRVTDLNCFRHRGVTAEECIFSVHGQADIEPAAMGPRAAVLRTRVHAYLREH
jgi:hypothetical protein